jgi:hypothetical protein
MLKLCTELLYCWMQHPAKYKAIWMKSNDFTKVYNASFFSQQINGDF